MLGRLRLGRLLVLEPIGNGFSVFLALAFTSVCDSGVSRS
jgi:hypothetical protein